MSQLEVIWIILQLLDKRLIMPKLVFYSLIMSFDIETLDFQRMNDLTKYLRVLIIHQKITKKFKPCQVCDVEDEALKINLQQKSLYFPKLYDGFGLCNKRKANQVSITKLVLRVVYNDQDMWMLVV
ncbi:hypothetical protein CR513_58443, partial [Mucuna pruriens]